MKRNHFFAVILLSLLSLFTVFSQAGLSSADRKEAFIVSHFHYDPVWTNTQAGETLVAFSIVHQDLEYAELEPRFKFILSEMDYLKPYWDAYPGDREKILKLIRDGRVEITGGYNEPDEDATGGEALIRNFAWGKLFKESTFGANVQTVMQNDPYGHTVQLPRILLGTGHRYAFYERGNTTDMPPEFYWLGADGSTILTKQRGYQGKAGDASFHAGDPKFYGLTNNGMFISGDDFTEPDRTISLNIKKTKTYDAVSGTDAEFFSAVEKALQEKGATVPEISRDQTFSFEGCFGSRIDTKLANRRIETLLADAEKFSTLFSLKTGAPYPWLELDRAWRLLFFGEHHDALPGTQTENVNLDLLTGWHEAMAIAETQLQRATAGIAAKIDTAIGASKMRGAIPLVIFNSMNWDRSEPVEASITFPKPVKAFEVVDARGSSYYFQLLSKPSKSGFSSAKIIIAAMGVPPFGYRVIYVVPAKKFPKGAIPARGKGTTLENDMYRIIVDPARGGDIVSLTAHNLSNHELIDTAAGLGNEIIALEEKEGAMSDVMKLSGRFWRSSDYPADSVEIERGAVFDKMIVKSPRHAIAHESRYSSGSNGGEEEVLPAMVREIILYHYTARIDFRTYFNNYRGRDIFFKVGFPANLPNAVPMYEERFASIGRERNTVKFLTNKGTGAVLDREYPSNNWLALSPAAKFSFISETGKIVAQFPLAVGEIITPRGDVDALKSANRLAEAFMKTGVTTTPTIDKNPRTNWNYGFRISLGYGMNNECSKKLLAVSSAASRAKLERDVEEKGAGLLFVETPDSATAATESRPIPILIVEAKDKEALDKVVDEISSQLAVDHVINVPAYANTTAYNGFMPAYGMALINNGTPGASVELPNTMTLTLLRSATGWPNQKVKGENWIRENWNHQFRYSIQPFRGGLDESHVVREGWDFNDPLIAVQTGFHKGPLPANRRTFVYTGGADIVLTALKPAGNPIAEGDGEIKGAKKVALRFYNPGMREASGDISFDFPVENLAEADFLDRGQKNIGNKNDAFPVSLSQFAIKEYIAGINSTDLLFKPGKAVPDPTGPPATARYWQTNETAAPQGFMPVALTLEPTGFSEDRKTLNLRVTVAGNLKDRGVSGKLKFELPAGAKVIGDTDYNIEPLGVKTFDLQVAGIDPKKPEKNFISVSTDCGRTACEDVLTFGNWKVFRGDIENGGAPAHDDSSWETLPLARFWSAADNRTGTTWYRKKFFVASELTDYPMLFEKPRDADIEVYINGQLARRDKWGTSYHPRIGKEFVTPGKENLIAIKCTRTAGGEAPLWGMAFNGNEASYNRNVWKLSADKLTVAPGGKSSFSVEITNPFDQPLEGRALLASPIETWKEGGAYSLIEITPSARTFSIKPGGRATVTFDVAAPPGAQPGAYVAAVKLLYKGIAAYTDTVRITVK